MDTRPLDWIMHRRDEVAALLAGYGLHNARVVGWAGAGQAALNGVPVEIEVDLPESTDLTGGDMARLADEKTKMVGIDVLVWTVPVGERRILRGEVIRYL